MIDLRLRTNRLELVAATTERVEADINDRPSLARMLEAVVPDDWPPPLNDLDSMTYALRWLRAHPDSLGWSFWYLVVDPARSGPQHGTRTLMGCAGFTGPPTSEGVTGVGYSVIPAFQRQGYACEAVAALLDWAFSTPQVRQIVGETMPELYASIRTMEKLGFVFAGAGTEPGVIRFALSRSAWHLRSGAP